MTRPVQYEGPPGPGAYSDGAVFGKDGQKATMGPDTRPGPMLHNAKQELVPSRRFNMNEIAVSDVTPGPIYMPEGTEKGKLTSPRITFPRTATGRLDIPGKDEQPQAPPGPGSYDKVGLTPYGRGATYQEGRKTFDTPAQPFSKERQRGPAEKTSSGVSPRFVSKELSSGRTFYGVGPSPGPIYSPPDGMGTALRGAPATNVPQFSLSPRLQAYQPPLGAYMAGYRIWHLVSRALLHSLAPKQLTKYDTRRRRLPKRSEGVRTLWTSPQEATTPARELKPMPVAFGVQSQATRASAPLYRFGHAAQRPEPGKDMLYLGKDQVHICTSHSIYIYMLCMSTYAHALLGQGPGALLTFSL